MKPVVSIITPTIRKEGLEIVRRAILKQSFKNYEWLIGSKFDPDIKEAIWVKDDFKGGYWSLNRIYNKLFKQAKGEIIVSLQDWIYIQPDGIEKFVANLKELGKGNLVTGVGNQFERVNKYGKPEICIWKDPRMRDDFGSFYEIFHVDCEFNWCAFWKKDIIDIGGMDENLDFLCRGVDAIQLVKRMEDSGCKFWIDQTNISFTIRHGREDYGGEESWNNSHGLFNGVSDKRENELKSKKLWPVLQYLR